MGEEMGVDEHHSEIGGEGCRVALSMLVLGMPRLMSQAGRSTAAVERPETASFEPARVSMVDLAQVWRGVKRETERLTQLR